MLSKLLPWDFVVKFPKTIPAKAAGVYSFLAEDPYLERALLDNLPRDQVKFALYSGNEFTQDFIEEHFVNLSLFSESDNILIINAENIPAPSLEFLLETSIDWSDRLLLLFFTKTSKSYTAFVKNENVHGIELEAPRFWEGVKLWQFCQKVRGVSLDGLVSRFALDNLEHNFESFFWLIDLINIHFPNGKVEGEKLKELVIKERWDFFDLVDFFHRDPKIFFQEVLKKELDFDWMRALSAFMQTHLIKILFPEEIKAKAKLSKYDQSVLEMSEKLNRERIKYYQRFFSDLEILSKSHDAFLINKIRLESIK